jgi:uncharacterized RDD family membrane protein YckC
MFGVDSSDTTGANPSEPNPYAPPQAELDVQIPLPVDDLELADRGTRLAANLLDGIIVLIPFGLIAFLCYQLLGWNMFEERTTLGAFLEGLAISSSASVLYFAVNGRLLARHGQSIGKKLFKIRIAKPDGRIPTLWDSFFKRYALFLFLQDVPLVGRMVPLIDALMIFRESRRCLHDELAETIVVKAPAFRDNFRAPVS